jgi:hypothetical protein
MTKLERRYKPCRVCGKCASDHPGGAFCKTDPPRQPKLEAVEELLTAMAGIDMNVIRDTEANVAFDALWNRLCTLRLEYEAKGGTQ